MITEAQLRQITKKREWGEWLEYHRATIGTAYVYEIWTTTPSDKPEARFWVEDQNGVKHKVSPQTRFILEDKNRSKEYFDYFSDLAPTLNERFITAERRGEALWLTRFNRYVAAIVLIGALGAVIYLLASGKATSEVLIFALGGVVASGGYLFFGRWLLPGTSDGTPTQP